MQLLTKILKGESAPKRARNQASVVSHFSGVVSVRVKLVFKLIERNAQETYQTLRSTNQDSQRLSSCSGRWPVQ